MFAEKHYPEFILPEELDAYLAKGWYRMGQTIFTTHFLCFGNRFYSAIWVRLALQTYQFSKSLRKLYRRNTSRFRIEVRPAVLNNEKERLYQKYKSTFSGILAPTLHDSLLDGEDYNIYDTFEVCVWENNKLIAFSFFDRGRDSAASIIGVYDPAYQMFSLGLFTMLVEITFCKETGMSFYYPGYVVPGYARFDYKLRIGPVDYYDLRSSEWLPYSSLTTEDIPLTRMKNKLKMLQQDLSKQGTRTRLLYYPLFEANLFGFWRAPYFDFPIVLHTHLKNYDEAFYMIVFDIRKNVYQLLKCSPFDDLQFYFNQSYASSFDPKQYFIELVVVDACMFSSPNPEDATEALIQLVI